jgi:hypothetical protein
MTLKDGETTGLVCSDNLDSMNALYETTCNTFYATCTDTTLNNTAIDANLNVYIRVFLILDKD